MRLSGKRAIVTGSSRGVGRAIATSLAAQGAMVVICGQGSNDAGAGQVDKAVGEITSAGGTAVGAVGPIQDPAFSESLVELCVETFGGVDILVNNAGVYDASSVDHCSLDTWRHILEVNLDAAFYLCRAALPHMVRQRWGRILNAGSSAGLGMMGGSAYCTSKSALFGLTRAVASDYGPYGITANCYNPEALTGMAGMETRQVFEDALQHYEARGYRSPAESAYLRSLGGPDGVAPWLVYLCSEEAGYLNGNVFAVDGRRVALIAWPEEERVLFRDADGFGPWSLEELEVMAPLVFPVMNRWPRREGDVLRDWESA